MVKRWSIYTLLCLLLLLAAKSAFAGVLTSESYSYLLGGQEFSLPVDILTQRGGYLVPSELLAKVSISPAREGEQITLRRGPVQIDLRLGEATARVDGRLRPLLNGPMLVADRLFIPAELLPDLAVALEVEGKFVLLTDFAADPSKAAAPTAADGHPLFQERWQEQTLKAAVRDGSLVGQATLTILTPSLLADPALPLPWGTRMRLRSLAESRTLVMVTLQNQALRTMAFDPAKLKLIGEKGAQYDFLDEEVAVDGAISAGVAPGAIRTSVLVFPKADDPSVSLYHEGTDAVLGRLPTR